MSSTHILYTLSLLLPGWLCDVPDRELIAQVILFSQGFCIAESQRLSHSLTSVMSNCHPNLTMILGFELSRLPLKVQEY